MEYLDVPGKAYLLDNISCGNKFAALKPRTLMKTIDRFSVFGCDILSLNSPEMVDQLLIKPIKDILGNKDPLLENHIVFPDELLDYWRD